MKKHIKSALKNILFILTVTISFNNCTKASTADTTKPITPTAQSTIDFWLTTANKSSLLQKQTTTLTFNSAGNSNPTIIVDSTQTYQTIDGFGFALTGGSAYLINSLAEPVKDALLKELFTTDSTFIGINYLRISVGASDLSANVFSYDDIIGDTTLSKFNITAGDKDVIPILQKIIALNPSIKILATPWSPPTWMKSNNSSIGGSLLPAYYNTYAKYFVKYIQTMQANGIFITAITPQNEPLYGGNNPSMVMQATEERDFIKNSLGPAFQSAGIKTKIIAYDHNADRPDYPITILNDSLAASFVDGSAFHLYAGDISALTTVHNSFPAKNVYFTEQWVGGPSNFSGDLDWHIKTLIIGATRNWSKNVIEWNLASDPNYQPHTIGGCTTCLGALTISQNVSRNVSYYIIGHASKFVMPGAWRIASNIPSLLPNVAFQNPNGKKILIVLNDSNSAQSFNIQFNSKTASTILDAGAVGTFIW